MLGITSEEIPQLCTRLEKAMEEAKKKRSKCFSEFSVELTDWRLERPFLSSEFVSEFEDNQQNEEDNRAAGKSMIELLLTCFLGGQTEFIVAHKAQNNKWSITIDDNSDPINKEFASKCSILALYYSTLAKFVEDHCFISCGRVNGALAAGIDSILHDYQAFVVILEKIYRKRSLTIHELWYRIQDITEIMKVLTELANNINKDDSRGANTLAKLEQFTSTITGSYLGRNICLALTRAAAVPYMESVQKWVFNGEIYDPYDEFMIIESFTATAEWKKMEDYWEKKYQIRKGYVPPFLQHLETKILNSGKYLNVIKECVSSDKDFKLAPLKELIYNEDGMNQYGGYPCLINEAYNHASKQLLSYMLKEYKIKERIMSVKRFFLLQQGDFVVQLLDMCDRELCKETSDIIPSTLNTLVEMAIRTQSTNDDIYRDEIRMNLQKLTLFEQLKKILAENSDGYSDSQHSGVKPEMSGYESFTLQMDCPWPISLVLNSKILSSYQILFRHLFYCKYIEKILCRVWLLNQPIRALPFSESRTYAAAHALRYKMMIFLENVEYYMMEVAIENHWIEFMEYFDTALNIDDLVSEHWKFLDRSLKDCLLGDINLFEIFSKILAACHEFGTFTIRMRKVHMEADSDIMTDSDSSYTEGIKSLTDGDKYPTFSQKVEQLTAEFDTNVCKLCTMLQDVGASDNSSKLITLYYRLKTFLH